MGQQIGHMEQNVDRWRQIIKGAVRKNIHKYIIRGDVIRLPKGKNAVLPMPVKIKLPRFRFADQNGGVGQGSINGDDGEIGDEVPMDPVEHERSIEISVPELLDILAEDLALPNLEPKQSQKDTDEKPKYNSRHNSGPRSLINKRETLKRAIARSGANGEYDPTKLIIEPRDFRYKSFRLIPNPHHQAVVFFLVDISGSITPTAREIIRIESFWLEKWVEKFYPKTVIRFIIHDAQAKEVNRDDFFGFDAGGSTAFLPAYKLCDEIIVKDYPLSNWNIYLFHWSDGDGYEQDVRLAADYMERILAPKLNLFGYEQIEAYISTGRLYIFLDRLKRVNQKLNKIIRLSKIKNRFKIHQTIKKFLGKP